MVEEMIETPRSQSSGAAAGLAESVPDYCPLTRIDIIALLEKARRDWCGSSHAVLVRLHRGIPGMVRPPPVRGPLARKCSDILALLVGHYREGPTPTMVERYSQLLSE